MSKSTSTDGNGLHDDALIHWMLHPERSEEPIVKLIHGLCLGLLQEGIPVFRVNFMVRTLHPQLEFMVFTWQPGGTLRVLLENPQSVVARRFHEIDGYEMEEFLVGHGHVDEEMFRNSPFHQITSGTPEVRCCLDPVPETSTYPILVDLIELGGTDYFALPLQLRAPYAGAMSFSSKAPGGFREASLDRLRYIQRVVSLFLAPVLTQQAAYVVLSAYLGEDPARRVMEGAVRLGDLGELDAVIGFIDLHRFTEISEEIEGPELVELLETFFSEFHLLLSRSGGEILKFMGDGALFVFPIGEAQLSSVCCQAADMVKDLELRMAEVNEHRNTGGQVLINYGLALHTGRVMYGNIGAPRRMDFTVIGPAVNLTSRLEGLCKRVGHDVVVTAEFAVHLPNRVSSLGDHQIRGVKGRVEVFKMV